MRTTLLFAVAALPISSFAIEYTLPSDGHWYQLQSAGGGQTFCESGTTETCDVPAGTAVKLINHSLEITDQTRIQNFIIQSGPTMISTLEPSPTSSIEVIYQPATATDVFIFDHSESLSIACPANTVVIGGKCRFYGELEGQDGSNTYFPMESESYISDNALICEVQNASNSSFRFANMSAIAVCAVGTSSTLPVIEVDQYP